MKIGVDVGGTKIRVGAIGDNGEVLKAKSAPCPSASGKQEVVDFIAGMIQDFFSSDVKSIGVAVPAIVDDNEVVHDCVNIPSWDVVDLKGDFEKRFNVPVSVRNDCNCYALGVQSTVEGSKFDNVVGITLGTGVGSGIVINGKLYLGVDSCAGEIGEIQYKGKNYEYWCSSQFFKQKGTSGKDAFLAAEKNDPEAIAIWNEFGSNVGDMLKMVMLAYSPQAIFLGGSISSAFQYFETAMRDRLKETFPYSNVVEKIKIFSTDSPDMVLAGAAV